MYSSTILSGVLVHVYQSKQWRAALDITFRNSEFPLVDPMAEESWTDCPPPSVVSFVGTLVS